MTDKVITRDTARVTQSTAFCFFSVKVLPLMDRMTNAWNISHMDRVKNAAVIASTRNAPRSFRAKAEHVVRRDRKGAVAEFLGIIERRALEGRQEAVLRSEGSL